MNNTPSLLLHLLLLFLLYLLLPLAPGGLLGCAVALQCFASFQTVDHKYDYIDTAPTTGDSQMSITKYVCPEQGLQIVLKVSGKSGKNYATEFLLEKDCFESDWKWWPLFMKVKRVGSYTNHDQVNTTYIFEVRTSTCVEKCIKIVNMQGLNSLNIWASGASQWKDSHSDKLCGYIPNRNINPYTNDTIPRCRDVNLESLLTTALTTSTTTPTTSKTTTARPIETTATTIATSAVTSTTTTTTPTPTPVKTTTTTKATSLPNDTTAGQPEGIKGEGLAAGQPEGIKEEGLAADQLGGVIGGVIAAVVVVAVVVVIVVRKRRNEPTTEGVAMRPQNTESPRAEDVSSLYETAYRQESAHDTGDRQASANSLYETVERHGSVNSLYEPFENFRTTQ